MAKSFTLTAKQIELMRVIATANEDGSPTDLDQILERIRYETTKPSLQFSIRALIGRGLIVKGAREKRRGHQRQLILATELGKFYASERGPARVRDDAAGIVDTSVVLGVELGAAPDTDPLPDLGVLSATELPEL